VLEIGRFCRNDEETAASSLVILLGLLRVECKGYGFMQLRSGSA